MPIYEYQCERCGGRFEFMQRPGEPPPGGCPRCGGPLRKLLSPCGLIFRGTGFYATDYASKERAREGRSEDKGEGGEGGEGRKEQGS